MKRKFIISLVLVVVLCLSSYAAPRPGSMADPDNPHNMSSGSTVGTVRALASSSGGTDEICIFCHTPHSAAPQTPLWSRPDPKGPNGDGSFPIYNTELIASDPGRTGYDPTDPAYPSGTSRMCLSCHDGATSVGVLLGNQTILMEGGLTTLSASIDLASSHPISFFYNNDVIINVLDPADYRLPTVAVDTPLDGAGKMQCTTCHDPHEDTGGDSSYGNLPFWRHNGDTSSYDDVCESCHWDTGAGLPTTPVDPPH